MSSQHKRAIFREQVRSVIERLETTLHTIDKHQGSSDIVWTVSVESVAFDTAQDWMRNMSVPCPRELSGEFDEKGDQI